MNITITINHRTITRDLADLTPKQKDVLGEFLGLNEVRDEIFNLPALTRFRPIKAAEVKAACPDGGEEVTRVQFTTAVSPSAPWRGDNSFASAIVEHIGRGHCRQCGHIHQVTRSALRLSKEIEGVPFSREFEL